MPSYKFVRPVISEKLKQTDRHTELRFKLGLKCSLILKIITLPQKGHFVFCYPLFPLTKIMAVDLASFRLSRHYVHHGVAKIKLSSAALSIVLCDNKTNYRISEQFEKKY